MGGWNGGNGWVEGLTTYGLACFVVVPVVHAVGALAADGSLGDG